MAFTVASWNVEFFGSRREHETSADVAIRIDRVFDYLRNEIDADVYAIYEVNGSQVFDKVTHAFSDYSWQITEGPGVQQILVGHRVPAFITQRLEFSRGFTGPLRPGLLVTVMDAGQNFPMLFVHLKSKDAPIDFGVRTYQHDKARSLRRALDSHEIPARANFVIAGDFNPLGMGLTFSDRDIGIGQEIGRLIALYNADAMRVRVKSHEATFWNGPASTDPPVDLDHVVAAEQVVLTRDPNGAEVEIKGWPEELTDSGRDRWIRDFSDHACLRFEVNGTS